MPPTPQDLITDLDLITEGLSPIAGAMITHASQLLAHAATLDAERRATRIAQQEALDAANADAEEEINKIKREVEENLNAMGMGVCISSYTNDDTGCFVVYDVDLHEIDLADSASISHARCRAAEVAAEQKEERRKEYEALKKEFDP